MAEEKKAPATIYKIGSKGDEVGKIQTALGDYYTNTGSTVDNKYGSNTHKGVWNWQSQWNIDNPNDQIKVDGIVGPQTYPRLMDWYAQKSNSAAETTEPETTSTSEGVGQTGETTPVVNPSDYTFTGGQVEEITGVNSETGTPNSGQGQQVTTPIIHKFDWGNTSLDKVMASEEGKKTPQYDILYDYYSWCQENGVAPNPWAVNDIIKKSTDLSLTPEDDEKARKKAERKERFDKIGNFLLHLGNAIGNVASGGYGAVKLEDPVQWTERQRMLKEKAEQQRILNNQSILAQMQKERTDQRAYEIKKQEQERKDRESQSRIEKNEAQINYQNAMAAKNEEQAIYWRTKYELLEKGYPLEVAKKQAEIALRKAQTAKVNRTGGGQSGGGSQETTTKDTVVKDDKGNVVKSTSSTTTKTKGKPSSSGRGGQSNNTKRKTKRQL